MAAKTIPNLTSGTPAAADYIPYCNAAGTLTYKITKLNLLGGLTLAAATTGFTISGGTTPKTLTLDVDMTASAMAKLTDVSAAITTAEGYTDSVASGKVGTTGNETVAGIKTFSSFPVTPSSAPTTDYQVCNKKYADDLAFAGVADATESTKGKAELATQAETDAGTDDARIVTPLKLATTTKIPAGVVTALGNKIETSYLDTDESLSANSDSKIATQQATKAYVDGGSLRRASYVAGEIIIVTADTARSGQDLSYTKKKEITINTAGTFRIKFDLAANNVNYTAYGRIYKNGSAVGTERSQTSTSYTTYTEDIAFAVGDKIQLYGKTSKATSPYYLQNFRISVRNITNSTIDTD